MTENELIDIIKKLFPEVEEQFLNGKASKGDSQNFTALKVSAVATAATMMDGHLNLPFEIIALPGFAHLTMILVKFGMLAERNGWKVD